MNRVSLMLLCVFLATGCQTTYQVKAKQSSYNVVKVIRDNEMCGLEQIDFKLDKNKVILEQDEFNKLTQNIVKLKICFNTNKEKYENNLLYYEDIITTLGYFFIYVFPCIIIFFHFTNTFFFVFTNCFMFILTCYHFVV